MTRLGVTVFLATLVMATEYPAPLVREEQEIVVDGHKEVWQLRWATAPEAFCSPKLISLTCPCLGFAYGESGDLSLIRLRDGAEIDRMHLTQFFSEERERAMLQRWPADPDKDAGAANERDFADRVMQRPAVQVMQFGDYDHESAGSEFYLQTGTQPCGKSAGIVVGITAVSPHLHPVTTASHPDRPLVLFKHEWEALRDAKTSPLDILDTPCGDHGAETETHVLIRWGRKGIDGSRREYTCPAGGAPKKLVRQDPL